MAIPKKLFQTNTALPLLKVLRLDENDAGPAAGERSVTQPTDEFLAELAVCSAELESASPDEILRWAFGANNNRLNGANTRKQASFGVCVRGMAGRNAGRRAWTHRPSMPIWNCSSRQDQYLCLPVRQPLASKLRGVSSIVS